jgi:hypothetical protein
MERKGGRKGQTLWDECAGGRARVAASEERDDAQVRGHGEGRSSGVGEALRSTSEDASGEEIGSRQGKRHVVRGGESLICALDLFLAMSKLALCPCCLVLCSLSLSLSHCARAAREGLRFGVRARAAAEAGDEGIGGAPLVAAAAIAVAMLGELLWRLTARG